MALEPSFSEAFIHRLARPFDAGDPWSAHRVLGRKLRPFCLWHQLLLWEIDSPFLAQGATAGPSDLARAVAICRCRYGETDTRSRFALRAFWRLLGGGFIREAGAFTSYVRDFQTRPEYSVIPGPEALHSQTRGQPPELLLIVADVLAVTYCTRAEAWEMPIGEALWWQAMARRAKGVDLDFMTAEERARQAALKTDHPGEFASMRRAAEAFEKGDW